MTFFNKLTHKKQYGSGTEERFRMKMFMENVHKVAKHNKLFAMGLVSYKLGINKYAHMLHHAFIHTVNGFNKTKNLLRGAEMGESTTPSATSKTTVALTPRPYKSDDEKCHYSAKNKGATDRGFVDIEPENELDLKSAVATIVPVSVAIDVSHQTFQL
ncbi:hypothetical protein JTB14_023711 [Gonioctena quinquepunctata]|nr:hypothetical protein JTB14_023711 [Gonioctena quinquepunctata]